MHLRAIATLSLCILGAALTGCMTAVAVAATYVKAAAFSTFFASAASEACR